MTIPAPFPFLPFYLTHRGYQHDSMPRPLTGYEKHGVTKPNHYVLPPKSGRLQSLCKYLQVSSFFNQRRVKISQTWTKNSFFCPSSVLSSPSCPTDSIPSAWVASQGSPVMDSASHRPILIQCLLGVAVLSVYVVSCEYVLSSCHF